MNDLTRAILTGALFAATLLGANVGPCIGVYGSLATILVLAEARQRGEDVRAAELARVGGWLTPAMLLLGVAALWRVLA